MNRLHPIRLCALVGCCAALGMGHAATPIATAKEEVSAQKNKIAAEYEAAKERCKSLSGNARDICMQEAKGNGKIAKAELEARRNDTPRNHELIALAKADAAYEVDKEKCDDLSGNPKDVCRKEAKASHAAAVAKAKVQFRDMRTEQTRTGPAGGAPTPPTDDTQRAEQTARDAQYKTEAEKCDALSGDARTSCLNAAKSRFGKN